MGCHTYFYIPANIDYNEFMYKFNSVLNECIKTKNLLKQTKLVSIGKSNKKYTKLLDIKEEGEYSLEFEKEYKRKLALFFRLKRIIKKGLCKKAVLNRLGYCFYNNTIYELCEFCDLFRVTGYPDITLTSYEETINFIDSYGLDLNKKHDVDYNKLKQFFIDYPTGIINFTQ